jgi:flagellar biosynthetic protein FliR
LIDLASTTVLAAFVVFSRIGCCLLLMPGFSSPRIPVQVRLFVAIALSLALTPLVIDELRRLIGVGEPLPYLRLMASELLIGATIGLMGRFFFIALETIGMATSMSIALSSNLGAPINEEEPLPAVATLLTLAATALLFLTDQHLEIFKALAASYSALPASDGFSSQFALTQLADTASRAFLLALRIGSPFLIFSVILNLAVGLTNRLVPTVQIFFLATPFLVLGGLFLLYFTVRQLLEVFVEAFGHFLVTG